LADAPTTAMEPADHSIDNPAISAAWHVFVPAVKNIGSARAFLLIFLYLYCVVRGDEMPDQGIEVTVDAYHDENEGIPALILSGGYKILASAQHARNSDIDIVELAQTYMSKKILIFGVQTAAHPTEGTVATIMGYKPV
jgi:hypothetical protein